ncbi:M20/M25/M40 family metallo-hydrolase [Fulvivirga sedimenti]|uniref:M20/M25/M40 family metallo-hydrolase n=1 Tax=Fulvivirga sedimenti TaxID=2879465 RepID=A0A9X1HWT2_9BACT|nr:M20/M25/M40 family metallo-hydrolase [Fulvivirga sedimenti]MCA6079076.1 M20/M25/M40 family metallo-hydrolase [Fulvivirga sedimenti]
MRITLLFLLIPVLSLSQPTSEMLRNMAADYTVRSFPELKEVLSLPNDALYPEQIEKNVLWAEAAFKKRGFETRRLTTPAAPLLLASKIVPGAGETVLFYFHLDGQPVDSSKWDQKSPYLPVLKKPVNQDTWTDLPWDDIDKYEDDWRIFGRSSSDDKSPAVMLLTALDALNDAGINPQYNIKVIMDFEEEAGSPNLEAAVKSNVGLLSSNRLVILDGPRHSSNQPSLSFGARGIATVTITTYGPAKPQHSGHYGNYAPNPAFGLAKILASMKDDDGRVTLPGYYDGVVIDTETEKILRSVPDDEATVMNQLALGRTDKVGSYYQESIQYPSLNIRGMQSGWINEEVRTIVPAWARAEIDIRLVPESDPEKLVRLVKEHIEELGYYIVDHDPTKEERIQHKKVARFNYEISYQAFRTDPNSETGIWLRSAMQRAFEDEPVIIRMSGGSVPIAPFINALNVPAVLVPTVNPDNNQHSPNENLRLGNYREGIQTMLAILTEPLTKITKE